jgi:3-hydroxyisobutyrate dehydrogenase-like beta-hydroxyacid dehydrogenase
MPIGTCSTPSAMPARYIGPIGAGSVAKLVHNCAGYGHPMVLAEVFSMGIKAGVEPLALWEAVRSGASGASARSIVFTTGFCQISTTLQALL